VGFDITTAYLKTGIGLKNFKVQVRLKRNSILKIWLFSILLSTDLTGKKKQGTSPVLHKILKIKPC